jgi:hypothetical protein
MKYIIFLYLILRCAYIGNAQYFNNAYFESGVYSSQGFYNVLPIGSNHMAFGSAYSSNFIDHGIAGRLVNNTGDIQTEILTTIPFNFDGFGYSQSLLLSDGTYFLSTTTGFPMHYRPAWIRCNSQFDTLWTRRLDEWMIPDTTWGFASAAEELLNGNIMLASHWQYDSDAFDTGLDSTGLRLTEIDLNGTILFDTTLVFNDTYYSVQDMAQTPQGDLLLWGYTNASEASNSCFVMKTTTLGVVFDIQYFGDPLFPDGSPELVIINNNEAVVLYHYSLETSFNVQEPHAALYNYTDMLVEWDVPFLLDYVDYECMCSFNGMIQTSDGNLAIIHLSRDYETDEVRNSLVKLDYNGNVLWQKLIPDPLPEQPLWTEQGLVDLENCPDGGYILSGEIEKLIDPEDESQILQAHWLVKTDACGDVEWINCPNSVQEFEDAQLEIYPNPSSKDITLSCDERIHQIDILDISGRMIISEKSNSFQSVVDIKKMKPGVYLLKVRLENGIVLSRKVIKE